VIKNHNGHNGGKPDPDPTIKYSWREFHPAATDSRGHGPSVAVRFPNDVMAQISVIVTTHKFPYETNAQLIRHAVMRHMEWLKDQEPVPSVLGVLKAMGRALLEEECNKEREKVYERIREVMERNEKEQDPEAMKENLRLVADIVDMLEDMPEGYWKEKIKRKFKRDYVDVLKRCHKVPLDYRTFDEG